MPGASVIIPAYNSGPFLDEATQSVIAQTFTDWECIAVDGDSTDSTEDLSRVEKNGPARAANLPAESRNLSRPKYGYIKVQGGVRCPLGP